MLGGVQYISLIIAREEPLYFSKMPIGGQLVKINPSPASEASAAPSAPTPPCACKEALQNGRALLDGAAIAVC